MPIIDIPVHKKASSVLEQAACGFPQIFLVDPGIHSISASSHRELHHWLTLVDGVRHDDFLEKATLSCLKQARN